MTISPRTPIYDDPHVRTLRKLANGISYPAEYISMMASILADNQEITADVGAYILSALRRLPDTDRHTIQSSISRHPADFERTLVSLPFEAKLRLVALVSGCLLRRGLDTTLDNQWQVLASSWIAALEDCTQLRAA